MSLLEQIEKQVITLPAEKQNEVLNFILFLQQQSKSSKLLTQESLKNHAAFGAWQGRNINALEYEENLRSEWER